MSAGDGFADFCSPNECARRETAFMEDEKNTALDMENINGARYKFF